jgi:1L-myo-inositol 1-phosphate cytidylyltransferase / CDP-L-myo-inositol myo-inositolphosphotransferase
MHPARLVVLASGAEAPLRRNGRPKPLVKLGGISLVERAIASATDAGFDEVVVVAGHRADQIEGHVLEVSRRRNVPVSVVRSDGYRKGIGLSALAARDVVGAVPFTMVLADHMFSPALLRQLRQATVEPGEILVAVDAPLARAAGTESGDAMKVRLADGRIRAIGEQLTAYDAFGIGAFVCGPALFDAVEISVAAGDPSLVAAIQLLAARGVVRALPIGDGEWWFGVDSQRDLRKGGRHVLRAAAKPLDGTIAVRINDILSQRVVMPTLLATFARITPNQITLVAFAAAVAAAAALALGAPMVAGLLVALASALDRSDGEMARLTYRSSSYGGFVDAVSDRAADGILFTGAAIYLATDAHLRHRLGTAQVPLAIAISGAALVCHFLVSYTTAKAAVDLDHSYRGTLLGGGRGRDRRLLMVTVGALAAAIEPAALIVSLVAVALFSAWIVGVRLRRSWWVAESGAGYVGVRVVALDFDGTVADSMGFLTNAAVALLVDKLGLRAPEAARRYLATAGSNFRAQLDEIAPGHPALAEVAGRFEVEQARWMERCELFADVVPAVESLRAAGIPVLMCSSTPAPLVHEFCERYGLLQLFTSVDGWAPGQGKSAQLATGIAAAGLAGHEAVFIGDARRDAEVAQAAGTRFVGLVRVGHPDLFAGSGFTVVASLSELAANVIRAVRSPVTWEAHDQVPASTPPST